MTWTSAELFIFTYFKPRAGFSYPKLFGSGRFIFSMYQKPSVLKRIIELGANGYLLKTLQNEELIYAIKKVSNGQDYFDSSLTKNLIENKDLKVNKLIFLNEKSVIVNSLSKREKEVIILVSEGFTNKQIGQQLFLSHKFIEESQNGL